MVPSRAEDVPLTSGWVFKACEINGPNAIAEPAAKRDITAVIKLGLLGNMKWDDNSNTAASDTINNPICWEACIENRFSI